MSDLIVETGRLELRAASVDDLAAFIAGDRERFEQLIDAAVPETMVAPPETADVLDWFRIAISEDEAIRPWFFRWIIERMRRRLVGSVGFAGHPKDDGVVLLGYSVYPEFEGRGYASEAATAMVEWALAQDRVTAVQATIFPEHVASQRVATKAGLRFVQLVETDDGMIGLWSIVKVNEEGAV
jgi:ribosomal-protein-alanine N-acetyltransferase